MRDKKIISCRRRTPTKEAYKLETFDLKSNRRFDSYSPRGVKNKASLTCAPPLIPELFISIGRLKVPLRAQTKEAYILALGRAFLLKEKVAGSTPAYVPMAFLTCAK